MCGPIAFMLPVDRKNSYKRFGQTLLYHLGRLMAYATIGLIFGLLGKGLYVFGLQQKLSIIIGALMIVIMLLPYKTFAKYNFSRPLYSVIGKLKNKLGAELKKKSPDTFLTIGFLNGFLPCGLVYMALFGAMAMGSAPEGSLYMVLFGLGTVPLMTVAVYFSRFLKSRTKQRIQKLIPVFVIIMGSLFILRGLGLGIPYVSPKAVVQVSASSDIECHSNPLQ
jgi:sulfite exporter TauE/SafE